MLTILSQMLCYIRIGTDLIMCKSRVAQAVFWSDLFLNVLSMSTTESLLSGCFTDLANQ